MRPNRHSKPPQRHIWMYWTVFGNIKTRTMKQRLHRGRNTATLSPSRHSGQNWTNFARLRPLLPLPPPPGGRQRRPQRCDLWICLTRKIGQLRVGIRTCVRSQDSHPTRRIWSRPTDPSSADGLLAGCAIAVKQAHSARFRKLVPSAPSHYTVVMPRPLFPILLHSFSLVD